jgi:hypothetical protein
MTLRHLPSIAHSWGNERHYQATALKSAVNGLISDIAILRESHNAIHCHSLRLWIVAT